MRTLIILSAALALCAGCIERTMRIKSEPPGATVYIDGEESGTTPLDVPFTAYGTREVFVLKQGWASRRDRVDLNAPVYAWFPIDFFTDVLYPFTIHDVKTFDFTLESNTKPDPTELQARAQAFCDKARAALAKENKKRGTESFSKGGYSLTPRRGQQEKK